MRMTCCSHREAWLTEAVLLFPAFQDACLLSLREVDPMVSLSGCCFVWGGSGPLDRRSCQNPRLHVPGDFRYLLMSHCSTTAAIGLTPDLTGMVMLLR